jgi:hypothetical protein
MPDIVSDGKDRVFWVPGTGGIAAAGSPTVAEINAGTDLTSWITSSEGLANSSASERVDSTGLNSTQNTELIGRRTDSPSITFKTQGKTTAPWTLFASQPYGFLVRRTLVANTTAMAIGDRVTVFPVQAGYRDEKQTAKNEMAKFSVDFAITGQVRDDAVVA